MPSSRRLLVDARAQIERRTKQIAGEALRCHRIALPSIPLVSARVGYACRMPDFEKLHRMLVSDRRLIPAADVLSCGAELPTRGIYGWFFNASPPGCPTDLCFHRECADLLYVGIAPSRDSSRTTVSKRLQSHLRGNTRSSTLRLSLASLLRRQLALRFIPAGKGVRLGSDEHILTQWILDHAFFAVADCDTPWIFEKALIQSIDLPLNLQHNTAHRFHPSLSQARSQARADAR